MRVYIQVFQMFHQSLACHMALKKNTMILKVPYFNFLTWKQYYRNTNKSSLNNKQNHTYKPHHEKTNNVVSEHVRHKPSHTCTEDG